MKESTEGGVVVVGNLFNFVANSHVICIPINTTLDREGRLVMGKGLAKQAKERYPDLPAVFGEQIKKGIRFPVYVKDGVKIKGLPTKHDWMKPSKWEYIRECVDHLKQKRNKDYMYFVPLLGGGEGRLDPDEVREYLKKEFSDLKNVKLVLTSDKI